MTTAIIKTDIKPRRIKSVSFLDSLNINKRIEQYKLSKAWLDRNLDNGEVFMDSLEVDYLEFEQDYLVQSTKQFVDRLQRIGFELIVPKKGYSFLSYYFNKKHQVCIAVYDPLYKDVIYKAEQVIKDSHIGGETAEAVFVSIVNKFKWENND